MYVLKVRLSATYQYLAVVQLKPISYLTIQVFKYVAHGADSKAVNGLFIYRLICIPGFAENRLMAKVDTASILWIESYTLLWIILNVIALELHKLVKSESAQSLAFP